MKRKKNFVFSSEPKNPDKAEKSQNHTKRELIYRLLPDSNRK